jgi:putative membrane protein
MISYFLAALPHFLAYFGSAVALAVAFLFIY